MMNDMMPGMMWGMGLVWLLVVIVLILGAAALIKYLRTGSKEGRQCATALASALIRCDVSQRIPKSVLAVKDLASSQRANEF